MKILEFDFLVVGSGLAGLVAAYHAAQYGSVALISKSELDISNSYHAQGGIAVAIDKNDSPAKHLADTVVAGRNLCDLDAVEILVNEGVIRIDDLIAKGMQFDCDEFGNLRLGLEGGHSERRILHADGDATGKIMTSFMLRKVIECQAIQTFEYCSAVRLLVEDGMCKGVQTIDYTKNENQLFIARATVLATGGLSRLYTRTTNPFTATGDGIALAWNAGARLSDMEFIQFHPTALAIEGEDAYLISEAVRGEGAHLIDSNGYRFMPAVHELAELAPRDVVAAAIFNQMQKTGKPVYLSLRHLENSELKERFHSIYHHLQTLHFDLMNDLIPIAPAAHYMVGGIRTDLWGQTSIEGLFACGEVAATGVMGANRLASNSLLECLVYGKRVIDKARQLSRPEALRKQPPIYRLNNQSDQLYLGVKNRLAEIMTENVGIVRSRITLENALEQIRRIELEMNLEENDYNRHKMENLIILSRIIATSALHREESRGGHIRTDFPEESDSQLHHTILQKDLGLSYEQVRK